jgi:hypothetical protein
MEFYASLWIDTQSWRELFFSYRGQPYRVTRADLQRHLRIAASEFEIRKKAYPTILATSPSRPALAEYPTDEFVSRLFSRPASVPDCLPRDLTHEARVMRAAVLKTFYPRGGYQEKLSAVQQWILGCLIAHQQFDLTDLFFSQLFDVITETITTRQLLLAPYICLLMREVGALSEDDYHSLPFTLPLYTPASHSDPQVQRRAITTTQGSAGHQDSSPPPPPGPTTEGEEEEPDTEATAPEVSVTTAPLPSLADVGPGQLAFFQVFQQRMDQLEQQTRAATERALRVEQELQEERAQARTHREETAAQQ